MTKLKNQTAPFQVVEGGRVRRKLVLNQHIKQCLADRFRFHDARLTTLAWETGHTQDTIARVINEIERAESMEIGRKQARWFPPMGQAA